MGHYIGTSFSHWPDTRPNQGQSRARCLEVATRRESRGGHETAATQSSTISSHTQEFVQF